MRNNKQAVSSGSSAYPWLVNPPIVSVRKELYRAHPSHGICASVEAYYTGPRLERMEVHSGQDRVDVPIGNSVRHSTDNGRTWTEFTPLPDTLHVYAGVEAWEGPGTCYYDPLADALVEARLRQICIRVGPAITPLRPYPGVPENGWTRQGGYLDGLQMNCFTYTRVSRDRGRTWAEPRQLRYEDGADFDPANPLKPEFLERNQAYFGMSFVPLRNGTLLHTVGLANDPHNDAHGRRLGALCFIGRWNRTAGDYDWEAGQRIDISPELSSSGLDESAPAELMDGRVLVVWRGTNTAATPGRKWFSLSSDGGRTLSAPQEWRYDDGTRFFSPSTLHRLVRHSVTGKLYWLGNISAVEPNGNWPRYPLVIAEVDEGPTPALKKHTVTAIDDRAPDQSPYVEFSNFTFLENRETHAIELYLTAFGERMDHINNADCYKYTLTLNA